jgi:hypothetical protein
VPVLQFAVAFEPAIKDLIAVTSQTWSVTNRYQPTSIHYQ